MRIFAALLFSLVAEATPSASGVVELTIVDDTFGLPQTKAQVAMCRKGEDVQTFAVDARGQVRIENMERGTYAFGITQEGWHAVSIDKVDVDGRSTQRRLVTLKDGPVYYGIIRGWQMGPLWRIKRFFYRLSAEGRAKKAAALAAAKAELNPPCHPPAQL
ncbi:MAG: hypothetical protein AAGA48_08885 [Myxococcota bacterium]